LLDAVLRKVEMHYFKKMVKHARQFGVAKADAKTTDMFWHMVELNEVFVYTPINKEPEDIHCSDCVDIKLDQPFPVWSVEIAGSCITTPQPTDEIQVRTYCLLMKEAEEGSPPVCFSYVGVAGEEGEKFFVINLTEASSWLSLAEVYINRLKSEKDGLQEVSEVVMIPKGKKKRPHTIRRVFHICPKSSLKTYEKISNTSINWTHQWSVRGTWMHFWLDENRSIIDMSRIGKDRQGEYCVPGRTWRVAHIKGPKHLPLVKKVRVVPD
jgi:hypothetical protein